MEHSGKSSAIIAKSCSQRGYMPDKRLNLKAFKCLILWQRYITCRLLQVFVAEIQPISTRLLLKLTGKLIDLN